MPQHLLVANLMRAGRNDLAQRALGGEWDGTAEEAEAWANRKIAEGGEMGNLISAMKRARDDR